MGQPTNGHPQASYALLDCDPRLLMIDPEPRGNFKLQFFQVTYDVEATVHSIRKANLPEAYAQLLLQSQDLDTVLKEPETWGFPETKENKWWVAPFKTLRHRKEKEDRQFEIMIQIAKVQGCNVDHLQQAEHLALRLFDELQPLHRLGPDERYWLRCGALLHDLGKPQGNKKHHKKARDMILNTSELPFNKQEEIIISLIARYHRKAWPKQKHDLLTSLPAIDQRKVTLLSSILRVADGLDSPRRGNVQDVKAHYSPQKIILKCQVKKKAKKERKRALGKGELMEFAFDRDLYIEWHKL